MLHSQTRLLRAVPHLMLAGIHAARYLTCHSTAWYQDVSVATLSLLVKTTDLYKKVVGCVLGLVNYHLIATSYCLTQMWVVHFACQHARPAARFDVVSVHSPADWTHPWHVVALWLGFPL